MPSEIVTSFLGALQASLSVLLTICYGVIAAQLNLLSDSSAKDISQICVRMFLPALLITNVGSQLHADTAIRYVPILSKLPQDQLTYKSVDCLQSGLSSLLWRPCCWVLSLPACSSSLLGPHLPSPSTILLHSLFSLSRLSTPLEFCRGC